ncbi:MAG: hypothetical protein IKN83_02650 [Bacteroidaceae bacterium]|nr:hypothetical protein [Bacteroidaceae bacterium]
MKKIFVFMLVLLLMQSCVYVWMRHFNRDDKLWLSCYEEGDTVLFKSHNDLDTLVVNEYYYHDTYNPFYSTPQTYVMNAYSFIEMVVFHKGKSLNCMLALTRYEDGTKVSINFDDNAEEMNRKDIVLTKKVIGKEEYDDVLVCTGKSSLYPSNNIEYYYWSKTKGLIQYKYLTGETYSIYKKLPNKKKKGIW